MSSEKRVLLAMSGGLDSSVAAIILKSQGWDIVGVTMKVFDYDILGMDAPESGCCNLDSINDARNIAVSLGFPHYVVDFRDPFEDIVINNFVDEYMSGRTTNPCVLCNTHIKWEALLEKADELDCKYIATGHYSQIRFENDRYVLSKGLDLWKDQSYMLWGLTQKSLSRTVFPLGEKTKDEIRQLAADGGFKKIANKRESYDICFVPDNNYRGFLQKKVHDIDEQIGAGDFVDVNGKVLGKHKGYPYYTIGQRKGLEIALGKPAYVKHIDAQNNRIVLAFQEDIYSKRISLKNCNFMKFEKLPENYEALVKIRYRDKGMMANLEQNGDKTIVNFHNPVSAVAPGQSAVVYDGNDVVMGGFIDEIYE